MKKNAMIAICRNTDVETFILTEAILIEKDKNHVISLVCGIYNMRKHWNIFIDRNRRTDEENKQTVTKGKEGRTKLGIWDQQIHTTIQKTEHQQTRICIAQGTISTVS